MASRNCGSPRTPGTISFHSLPERDGMLVAGRRECHILPNKSPVAPDKMAQVFTNSNGCINSFRMTAPNLSRQFIWRLTEVGR